MAISLLVLGAVVMFLPLFWLIRSAFMSTGEIFIFPPLLWSRQSHWDNFLIAWTTASFPLYFLNTLRILVPVMVGTLVTSSMSAYGFARLRFPLKRFWFALILSSLMLPYAVYLIPTFILWSRIGAVNTFYPLIVPVWFGGGAFNVFLLRQFFLTIPKDFDDAARIDGAGYFTTYVRIMLPLIQPALIAVGLFTFMAVWNDFLNPLIYLNVQSKYTLALGLLQFQGTYSSNWPALMAASAMLVIIPIVVFAIGQKYFIQGIALTGVKG
jgi:multiple sugar transport system permease protein